MLHNHLVGAAVTNMTTSSTGAVILAMTDNVIISIVGGIVSLVTGIATVYFAYKSKTISAEAKDVSEQTGKAVNGKMEEFKRMAEEYYHAKGVADEKLKVEAKAGAEAVAKAAGKAEGKAESVVYVPVAELPPTTKPTAVKSGKPETRIGEAIEELTEAAEETSAAAETTVDLAKKHPR